MSSTQIIFRYNRYETWYGSICGIIYCIYVYYTSRCIACDAQSVNSYRFCWYSNVNWIEPIYRSNGKRSVYVYTYYGFSIHTIFLFRCVFVHIHTARAAYRSFVVWSVSIGSHSFRSISRCVLLSFSLYFYLCHTRTLCALFARFIRRVFYFTHKSSMKHTAEPRNQKIVDKRNR